MVRGSRDGLIWNSDRLVTARSQDHEEGEGQYPPSHIADSNTVQALPINPLWRSLLSVTRRTNDELYALIEQDVLPEIQFVKGELKQVRAHLTRAGLDNGHAADVKEFFDRRAKWQAGLEWVGETLHPLARLKVIATAIGVLSALAWGILGFQDLIASIHPSHP